ncbi:MAG TPA: polysaccharide biosynthesis tyrosine autokinase [Gemmatimonadaceae bacterium]|nr:polysaccharide biosynthesis tyrosine autokinase [Gemmatimonadaceae bacterium]
MPRASADYTVSPYGEGGPPGWAGPPVDEPEGVPWARYIDALKRHTPVIAALVVAGSLAGLFFARQVKPVYDVQSTVWITPSLSQQSGPIRAQQLLPPTSWIELLRSFAIIDPVVRNLRLNVSYPSASDSTLFREFESLPSLRPGSYSLDIQRGQRYVLSAHGIEIERGALGDSIGRKVGFGWVPPASLLAKPRRLEFSVASPRSTSAALLSNLHTSLSDDGQFLSVSLSGTDPARTARTLNAWADQFVASSGDLKKRHLLEFKKILSDQLGTAEQQLRSAEIQLEQFRVNTITLPSGDAPVAGGVQATRDPVISSYFQQKESLAEVQAERSALERIVSSAAGGPLRIESFLMVPTILNNTPQLRTAIDELSSRQAALRTEQQFLTDANPRIKQLVAAVHTLEYETIPRIVQAVLQNLRTRERDMNARVDAQSRELRAIPSRTIEEMRLVRQVGASENLFSVLKARYEEVSLAEAQSTPDLSMLDYAIAPTHPSSNEAPRFFLLAVLASIGFAIAVSLFHDRVDRRFRYPEQATHDLGLTVAGTVPRFRPDRQGDFQVVIMSQAVESFRTLKLGIRYAFPGDAPVVLTVSSPNSGDGKSLVSSNLALAFASAGHRTLLIDGDVRRGALHGTFDVPVTPGLVEYLCDNAGVDDVVKATSSENLFLLPRGARRNRAPELLLSEAMSILIQSARRDFEVVIIDSPPFSAGVDAYALGAAAGSILVVLRPGVSDRKLAAAKLQILDRLPIRILGAVLNGVPIGGLYRYYGTDYTYADGRPSDPVGSVATPKGLVLRA